MSDFLSSLMKEFTGSNTQNQQSEYDSTPETYNSFHTSNDDLPPPAPEVPFPWRAYWDEQQRGYYYVNMETGDQVHDIDEVMRRVGGYEIYDNEPAVDESQKESGGHGLAYGAAGGVVGLAGGAALMYGGGKLHDDYEADKHRVEQDVETLPENAAQWTGNKVGEIEAIPQDIENNVDRFDNRVEQGFDSAVTDVVDAPENAASWVGGKVGDAERFGDNVEGAYDQGRYEGRSGYDY